MRLYYEALNEPIFDSMPVTFHLTDGTDSKDWEKFEECYLAVQKECDEQPPPPPESESPDEPSKPFPEKEALLRQRRKKPRNLWIVKPG